LEKRRGSGKAGGDELARRSLAKWSGRREEGAMANKNRISLREKTVSGSGGGNKLSPRKGGFILSED